MKRITQIILRAYLRRNPVRFRLSQYNFLSRYSWLKNVLEDLQPELFPQQEEETAEVPISSVVEEAIPASLIHPLIGREIEGDRGIYQIESFQSKRGNGLVFTGRQVESQQPITIKVYRLECPPFGEADSRYRQQAFTRLAGLKLADERVQDFRVVCPTEAIADPHLFITDDDTLTYYCCYLITDAQDSSPTLARAIAQEGAMPPALVRLLLEQTLQALAFLHQQTYLLPSGQVQAGLIHGNLSLESLLLVSHRSQTFTYLTDLALWEGCFVSPTQALPEVAAKPPAIAEDLNQVGVVGLSLLNGTVVTEPPASPDDPLWPRVDPELEQFIRRLLHQGAGFTSAEEAWKTLLEMNHISRTTVPPIEVAPEPPETQRRSPTWLLTLLGVTLFACLGAVLWTLWMRPSTTASEPAPPTPCCLDEINAVPEGRFTYTAVEQGTWDYVERQTNLLQRGQTLDMALRGAQPSLTLTYQGADTTAGAIAQVQDGDADFAVVPLTQPLPPELDSQTIAYDGLVMLVSFSYSERSQGIPNTLNGRIALEDVRSLYSGRTTRWKSLGGPDLHVKLYATLNPEALAIFEQAFFNGVPLRTLPGTEIVGFEDTLDMLQAIIRDFEAVRPEGSIGFAPLSEVVGQCSVYPLALQKEAQDAVQPLVLTTGAPITPNTDLCDRKGAYHPDVQAFRTGTYPLAYPISVVYPRDNRRALIGRKFAELMTTDEGQALLAEAGLVPLHPARFSRIP